MPSFQAQVYPQPAPGVEGDFCDHNPRSTVDAGPGGLVAGQNGVIVGHFGWLDPTVPNSLDPNNAPTVVQSTGTGTTPVGGFVHREQQGLITSWLGGSSMMVMGGFPVTLFSEGGFFVKNNGAAAVTLGQKAFARQSDGAAVFGAAGATVAGAIETKWIATSAGNPGELVKISSWPLG